MAEIKKIYDDAARTTQVYPQTHERAVVDNNGTTAETKFGLLQEAYVALTQSDIVVVADHTAVASPQANTIYREQGTTSYTDWMYYDSRWKKMAEYDGGYGDGVYDVSAENSGATYSDFAYILNTSRVNSLIPKSVRTGGMTVKYNKLTLATYQVTKTEDLETQPTGTELLTASSVVDGVYTASSLTDFSTLPTTVNSTVTYYYTVTTTETVDEEEVTTTTYTSWVVKMLTTDIYDYEQWRYVKPYSDDTTGNANFSKIENWRSTNDKEFYYILDNSSFTWTDKRYITASSGEVYIANGVQKSNNILVRAGSILHATGSGTISEGFAVIAKYVNGTYQALAVMNSSTIQEYVVTAYEDMTVSFCGSKSGTGALKVYIEYAGSITDKVLTPTNTRDYIVEEVPYSKSMQPIPMNVGDIACLRNPMNNNDLMNVVNAQGTKIRGIYRYGTGNAHDYTLLTYQKTESDGVEYLALRTSDSTAWSHGYILRKKPQVNNFSESAYADDYDTIGTSGTTMYSGRMINRSGNIVQTSGVNASSDTWVTENKGYKSVWVRTVAPNSADVDGDNYAIAFYNGEPSSSTFLPIQSKSFKEFPIMLDSGPYEFVADVPAGATYIAVCVRRKEQKAFRFYKNRNLPLKNDIIETFDSDYGKYVLPFAYQHASVEYLENDLFSDYKKLPLKMLFYTDLHDAMANLNRIMLLGDKLYDRGLIDCIVAGGDNVQQGNRSYDIFNYTLSKSKVDNLVAVGNHDASTTWSATQASAYTKNIAPVLERVQNIVAPEDSAENSRLYYYKDYSTVRVIVIYTPVKNDSAFNDTTQLPWLQNVLADAKTNSKHVVLVNHHYYNPAYKWIYSSEAEYWASNPNPFLTPIGKNSSAKADTFIIPNDYLLAVKTFEDAGGQFVCWLTGHGHFDNFFDVEDHTTYGYQPMFNSGSCNPKYSANEFTKKRGEKSMDLFNYITVDTTSKLLHILRIGCNIDRWGRSRTSLTYHYGNHCIVSYS